MKARLPIIPAPETVHAVKHATRALKPHAVFLFYRVVIFVPAVLFFAPHHAGALIDVGIVESSGIVVVWLHKFRHALRSS